jgi:plastocyanin
MMIARAAGRDKDDTMQLGIRSARSHAAFVLAALILAGGATWAAGLPQVVFQAGRMFRPAELTVSRGEAIKILNDDGDLLHHVYVDSDLLNFDSGDQKPGSTTNIVFPLAGDFTVLCAIHPKMKLVVHVK